MGDLLDCDWADGLVFEPDKSENGEGIKRVAQVVEHVIAFAVDDAAFQDRVIQPAVADQFFGGEFRLVIARSAIGPGAEKTDQRDFFHTGSSCGFDDVGGAFDMNPFVSLTFDFAIDARAMCDGIASVECAHELGGIGMKLALGSWRIV
jgi:hypothetical protein